MLNRTFYGVIAVWLFLATQVSSFAQAPPVLCADEVSAFGDNVEEGKKPKPPRAGEFEWYETELTLPRLQANQIIELVEQIPDKYKLKTKMLRPEEGNEDSEEVRVWLGGDHRAVLEIRGIAHLMRGLFQEDIEFPDVDRQIGTLPKRVADQLIAITNQFPPKYRVELTLDPLTTTPEKNDEEEKVRLLLKGQSAPAERVACIVGYLLGEMAFTSRPKRGR